MYPIDTNILLIHQFRRIICTEHLSQRGYLMYRLLIVDSDPSVRESIQQLINWSHYGFGCIMTAANYTEAINKAIDMRPHIAIVDIRLGEHYGFELVAHLRSIGLKTAFCIISKYDDFYYIRKSMQACAQDYLLKPVSEKELRSFVERILLNELSVSLPDSSYTKQEIDPVLKVPYAEHSKITNKIILFIQSNYQHSLSLTSIAETLNMSSKYIGRIFLKDTGLKFTDYLMAYRMLEAQRIIVNTQEKISVIAGMVGYSQLNNFYTHFRNYFGFSPSELRQFDNVHKGSATVPHRQNKEHTL